MKKIKLFINHYNSETIRILVRFMIIQKMYLLIASIVDENKICELPKCKTIFGALSNCSSFQYCDSWQKNNYRESN